LRKNSSQVVYFSLSETLSKLYEHILILSLTNITATTTCERNLENVVKIGNWKIGAIF
jgi:hypothetical protein